jgi:hypothetical protein
MASFGNPKHKEKKTSEYAWQQFGTQSSFNRS